MFQKTVLKPSVFQLIYSQLWARRVQVYWRSTMISSVKTNLELSQTLSFWNEKTECVLWSESFCRCLLPPRARLVGRPGLKMLEGKFLFPLLRYLLQDELQIVCETCFDGRYFYVDHLSCLLSRAAHWHFFFSNDPSKLLFVSLSYWRSTQNIFLCLRCSLKHCREDLWFYPSSLDAKNH